jgi:hypothetical protein
MRGKWMVVQWESRQVAVLVYSWVDWKAVQMVGRLVSLSVDVKAIL